MANDFLFTSESVSEAIPTRWPTRFLTRSWTQSSSRTRVRAYAETLTNTGLVIARRRDHHHAHVDYIRVARDTIKRIGYDNTEYGIDYKAAPSMVCYDKRSNDIAKAWTMRPTTT